MAEAELKANNETFQARVQPWMMACFGPEISADKLERNDRFLEEALELAQAGGYPKARAYRLIEYVYGRPQGDINQEVGGVMVTLAAHCLANGVDMHQAAETELARIWTKVEQIRAKQAAKPKGSAWPVAGEPTPDPPREELARLGELLAKATPGEWHHVQAFQTVPAQRPVHGPVPAQRVDYVSTWPGRGTPPGHRIVIDMEGRESSPRSDDMAAIVASVNFIRKYLSTLSHADAPRLANDGRAVMPEGCAEVADMRPTQQVAREDAPSPVAAGDELCEDCPPVDYPTDKTRCDPCPRRATLTKGGEGGR